MQTVQEYYIGKWNMATVVHQLPPGAQVTFPVIEDSQIKFCALVDFGNSNSYHTREFMVVCSNTTIDDGWEYLSSVQGEDYLWHLFERKSEQ